MHDVKSLGGSAHFEEDNIPGQFVDLKPQSIRARGGSVFFHLSGCVDNKVYLIVRPTQIDLTLGEDKGHQVLFQSASGAP